MIKDEIQKVVDAYVAAWNRGDASEIAQLFDAGADYVTPLGSMASGRVAVGFAHRLLLEGILEGTEIALEDASIVSSTHCWGLYRATWKLHKGGTTDKIMPRNGVISFAIYMDKSAWYIASCRTQMTTDKSVDYLPQNETLVDRNHVREMFSHFEGE